MDHKDQPSDVLRFDRKSLQALFMPRRVAVIGATEKSGKLGRIVFENLLRNDYAGDVYPVNPKYRQIFGHRAYRSVREIEERISLAVVVVPAHIVPNVIRDCVAAGIRSAIIISAGFRERGVAGQALEEEILAVAREGRMRVVGPNSLGIMNPHVGLNATAAVQYAYKGNVAFLSQSAALSAAVLDWSRPEHVGFSAFVNIGGMIDVDWADLVYYFGDDYRTKSIIIYMETIHNARSFLSAAREVSMTKPIIIIKPSRTAAGARAVRTHTGLLTMEDEVFEAALRRAGVLRVDRMAHLFYMAETLAKQPRPRGKRLVIVTNAGGPGILAADALTAAGGEVSALSSETINDLDHILQPVWSRANPIDVSDHVTADAYASAVRLAGQDPQADGVLTILTPQRLVDPRLVGEAVANVAAEIRKPLLASWMGGERMAAGLDMLNAADIPTFEHPDIAARVFHYMWRYSRDLKALYETPQLPQDSDADVAAHQAASDLIERVRATGQELLDEADAQELLAAYQIPILTTRWEASEAGAVAAADEIGYPVAVKLNSNYVVHKMAIGGVFLNVRNAAAVRFAYQQIEVAFAQLHPERSFEGVMVQPMVSTSDGVELIVGSSVDPQFGPIILLGRGGHLVKLERDRALGLPPLNSTQARRLIEGVDIVAGLSVENQRALEMLLVRFSQLLVEQPWIKEIDINPLVVREGQMVAIDMTVLLHPSTQETKALPKPAIRPYPQQYVASWVTKKGEEVLFRPVRPEDEPLVVTFHGHLSDESVYYRYFQTLSYEHRISHERMVRQCYIDYNREIALVVERPDENGQPEIIAIGRLSKVRNMDEAEFAMIVRDDMHGQGIGSEMLRRLIDIGRREDIGQIVAWTLPDNGGMKFIFRRLGFDTAYEDGVVKFWLPLRGSVE